MEEQINAESVRQQFEFIKESFKNLRDRDIAEIKSDIKEIKESTPNRREMDGLATRVDVLEKGKASAEDFKELKGIIYKGIGAVLLAVIGAAMTILLTKN